MPYHRKSAADYDLAIVNNVVRARQIQISLYGLQQEISSRCGYEDDISFLGLLDVYSQEERRLVNSHSLYEGYKANGK